MSTSSTSGGWNRPSAAPKPPPKKPGALRGLVAGLVVVLLAVGAYFAFFSGDDAAKPPREKSAKTIKTAKPAKAAKATPESIPARPARAAMPEQVALAPADDAPTNTAEVVDPSATTNAKKKVKRPFKSRMETYLNMTIPRTPGERMPPPPFEFGEDEEDPEARVAAVKAEIADIEKGFKNQLKVEEGESEASAERKAIITDAKEEFRELMKEGMTLKQYLKALQNKFNNDADFLNEAQKMIDEQYDDKTLSDEDYQTVKAKVDKLLADRGLPATEDETTLAAKEEAEAQAAKDLDTKKEQKK